MPQSKSPPVAQAAQTRAPARVQKTAPRSAGSKNGDSTSPEVDTPGDDLWDHVRDGLTWQDIEGPGVEQARSRYLSQDQYLPMISERAALYLHYIVAQVEARGMPMELALLPIVESTLDPFATSAYRAAGLWQIMPATGEHLGLEQDWWFDGRRDIRASTQAALDYLEYLHTNLDGDWLLALAAYNAGQGRVQAAMESNRRKGKPTDYWSLSLPRETRKFVPRLIAISQIVADPDHYAVELPALDNAPAFRVVATGGQIEMAQAAALADVDLGTLRALNPGQLRWATSPSGAQELLLPVDAAPGFESRVAELDTGSRVRWRHYQIRRGDSLIEIARRFDIQVGTLRAANQLKGSFIRAGDTLLIPYGNNWAGSLAMQADQGRTRRGYRVKRGDSLYRIASRFQVSIDDIIDWNSLDPGAYLQPGQQLTLYVEGG
ncbi:LysM peptidoglycan-binding domain-containing protein [Haliea sp. E17]|uniref:LysM peptidoglycan-binding domain-containing protein n=1 Tax=Haliea sp. E17 TaxID=3401576 RepID=UPI003AAD87B3